MLSYIMAAFNTLYILNLVVYYSQGCFQLKIDMLAYSISVLFLSSYSS